ncbi:MAG: glycosyl hydrolase family 65 protein [Gemmatimonadota bacterium]|nr:glycosyl hydrolase family 65 protein [Gemmatimonadota bacterium]
MSTARNWTFVYEGFEPEDEKHREALCTLGNGYFSTRGALPGAHADEVHYPGTYRAGLYDRQTTTIEGTAVENESLVNLPNWLWLTLGIEDGDALDPRSMAVLEYTQTLDLRQGILTRNMLLRDGEGRESRLTERRLVSMASPHLAALELTVTPVNWSGELEIRSGLDGRVENSLVARYRDLESRHLEPVLTEQVDPETVMLVARTIQSRISIAEAARTQCFEGERRLDGERSLEQEDDRIAERAVVDVREGVAYRVEKVASLFTSQDRAISESAYEAPRFLVGVGGFEEILAAHVLAWKHVWERCEIEVEGREGTTRVVRLYTFHLLQTVSTHTTEMDVGVPARGWTGEAYRGHVFWDELFIFPTLVFRFPEATRALLMYRHRRLPEARRAAREAGYRGAMFPWQSGSNGEEETQRLHLNPSSGRWHPDNSRRQRHVNAAIPYNVWLYHQATGDREFFDTYGAELILETARFWASIAEYDATRDRYGIHGVLGPDEFHDGYPDADEPGLSNNAYTNVMAVWTLCRGLDALEALPEQRRHELQEEMSLDRAELDRWAEISKRMFVPFHDDGIISQFEGWEELEELDWAHYRKEYGDIHRLDRILKAEGDTPNRYKACKQADALMLLFLLSAGELVALFDRLGYAWDPEVIPKMVEHYLHRTSHGSTLSAVVHSWVLARRDREGSWRFFHRAVESDVHDVQGGTTPEGIHLGAMAGTVDLLQRGYAGLELRGDVLHVNPSLPAELTCVALKLEYRNVWMKIDVTRERLTVTGLPGHDGSVEVACGDQRGVLGPGATLEFDL